MKIKKINIQNYRLLKDFSLELKSELSLIVGKNNCGKTSVLSVLKKIINERSSLSWEDINLYHRKVIFEKIKIPALNINLFRDEDIFFAVPP